MDEDVQALLRSRPDMYRIILATAWLHDVCDHKYPKSISKEKLFAFIRKVMSSSQQAEWVINLISNISYSKQAKGLCDVLPPEYQLALDVVRDADRYEAIGKDRGLLRCRQYTMETNKGLSESDITRLVYEHCVEKLEILLPKRYISTKAGRRLSLPRHAEIVQFMQQYNPNFKPTPIAD
jgi:HD superfamily phosphodiesterase